MGLWDMDSSPNHSINNTHKDQGKPGASSSIKYLNCNRIKENLYYKYDSHVANIIITIEFYIEIYHT
jgi:hypothetical protein